MKKYIFPVTEILILQSDLSLCSVSNPVDDPTPTSDPGTEPAGGTI